MWEQVWGSMVWGTVAVPVLGPLAAACLAAALLAAAAILLRRNAIHAAKVSAVASLLLVPFAVAASQISLPHTFVNGTTADADEVNQNFDSLVAESNDQDARISALEGGSTVSLTNCAWTACMDTPTTATCPANKVLVGVDVAVQDTQLPLGCNGVNQEDDIRFRCCSISVD